jgi:hypothetical protein
MAMVVCDYSDDYDKIDMNILKKIEFIWVNKDLTLCEWFLELLFNIGISAFFGKLKFKIFF